MGRRLNLLIFAIIGFVLTMSVLAPEPAFADDCGPIDAESGICANDINGGDSVDVGADKTNPGDGGSDGRNNGGGGGDNSGGGDSGDGDADGKEEAHVEFPCRFVGTCPDEGSDPITIHDLASFTPAPTHVTMEPDGWMIVGLPANFYADADVNTDSGKLFEFPITVRFTPSSYSWSWGDGSTASTGTGGSSWKSLGVEEFTATSTSHTYAEKGTYTVSLTVNYSVQIKTSGTGWLDVDGTLTKAASGVTAIATTANSVIVDKECNRNPTGPGC
ncbi:PKD domain-containing protein [Paramicrobacterium fandaimingii]|uniref:PKD domain-containing protein n=1 Tax=Paramicrobacterium fandaimingii TaxID=2708079 RepID=UPI0014246D1C|nr:PKD domain-containing protein [Microbacterium fandaimingii]